MYYDLYDDSYDIRQLQRLPQFANMTEVDLRQFMSKVASIDYHKWKAEVESMQKEEREKTLKLKAEGKIKPLPQKEIKIDKGMKINPKYVDDNGFISVEDVKHQKYFHRISIDDERKIYIG